MANAARFVEQQYSGERAHLRAVYEAIILVARRLGADVEVVPKKEYVMLRRKRQFANIAPEGMNAIGIALCLDDVPAQGRLESVESYNSFVTHCIRVRRTEDVDAEVERWLRSAYDHVELTA